MEMKRYFVETNSDNMVAFVDSQGMAYIIDAISFSEPLTYEVAKNGDYSNLEGCKTAEECYYANGFGDKERLVVPFSEIEEASNPYDNVEPFKIVEFPIASCGENCRYALETGTLTIMGSGDMTNFNWDFAEQECNVPWYDCCKSIKSVIIEEGVTSIGDCAFMCCTELTDITIPNSVTSIGDSAFMHCTKLKEVTIPNGVTSIGANAFSGCIGLTEIIIPYSVTSIGCFAFADCAELTNVTLPQNNKCWEFYFNEFMFMGCSKFLESGEISWNS